MNEFNAFMLGLFENSWRAALLITAIFALRYMLGKKIPPGWRFGIWLLVAIPLIFRISFPAAWSIFNLVPSGSELLGMAAMEAGTQVPQAHFASKTLATTDPQFSFFYGLLLASAVWLGGCVFMAGIFARQINISRKWIANSKPINSVRALAIFDESLRRMNVKTRLRVSESPEIPGPFLIGVFRPSLLLPYGMAETASGEQLRTIFLHELAHLKRRDVWTSWLMSALLLVHWFNPFLWAAIRKMNADREEACDVMALETLSQPERLVYGRALLDIAENFLAPKKAPGLLGIAETMQQMTGRIEMVEKTGTWKRRWKIVAGIVFVLLAVNIVTDAEGTNNECRKNSTLIPDCNSYSCDPTACYPMQYNPDWCKQEWNKTDWCNLNCDEDSDR